MKKLLFFLAMCLVIVLCIGCPDFDWGEPNSDDVYLPDTNFYVSPEKTEYSVDEELQLCFSSIPDFSLFDVYKFEILLSEYNEDEKDYKATGNLFFIDKASESDSYTESFKYGEKDIENESKVTKTFSIKTKKQGKFSCFLYGNGWHYGKNGSQSAVSYSKKIYIEVVE